MHCTNCFPRNEHTHLICRSYAKSTFHLHSVSIFIFLVHYLFLFKFFFRPWFMTRYIGTSGWKYCSSGTFVAQACNVVVPVHFRLFGWHVELGCSSIPRMVGYNRSIFRGGSPMSDGMTSVGCALTLQQSSQPPNHIRPCHDLSLQYLLLVSFITIPFRSIYLCLRDLGSFGALICRVAFSPHSLLGRTRGWGA